MLHGCPLAVDDLDRFLAMREAKAAELLFAESLKTLDMDGTRLAMAHMFKGAATVVKRAVKEPIARASISAATASSETSAATASSETKKPAIQMRMSSYLQDSMMMDEMKKKERARKAKETRAKKVASANTSASAAGGT
jgi:hypothetical protein